MIKKIRSVYTRELLRPTIYMAVNRFLIALILLLVSGRLFSGAQVSMYTALLLGIAFILLGWIAWLRLDGVRLPKMMMKRINIGKKPARSYGDIIDYVDEKPVTFGELDDAEKDVCCLLSDLACAVIYIVVSFVV